MNLTVYIKIPKKNLSKIFVRIRYATSIISKSSCIPYFYFFANQTLQTLEI